MMYIEDICGELWSISVNGDIKGKVNHPDLYFHFFHTKQK